MIGSIHVNTELALVQESLVGQFQEHALGIYEVGSLGNSRKEAGPEGSKSPLAFASFEGGAAADRHEASRGMRKNFSLFG